MQSAGRLAALEPRTVSQVGRGRSYGTYAKIDHTSCASARPSLRREEKGIKFERSPGFCTPFVCKPLDIEGTLNNLCRVVEARWPSLVLRRDARLIRGCGTLVTLLRNRHRVAADLRFRSQSRRTHSGPFAGRSPRPLDRRHYSALPSMCTSRKICP
jgi:hypothetical protein